MQDQIDPEVLVHVYTDHFSVFGRQLVTPEELLAAVEGCASIRLKIDPEAGYERIGKAIYTCSRAGALVTIDNPADQ